MKKIILFAFIIYSFTLEAQSLSYADQAVLFSSEGNYGTARYMGMGGAFGALGGDMTAVEINPAGLAVFTNSQISTTLNYQNIDTQSTFYGSNVNSNEENFELSQIGGVIIFPIYTNSDFSKFVLGFNYNLIQDFNNNYAINGNSDYAYFTEDPNLNFDRNSSNDVFYTNVDDQFFINHTSGFNSEFTTSIATQYKERLFLGASMGFQNIDFYQNTIYEEYNNDGNGNLLDAFNTQSLSTYGYGFNFNIGAILKATDNLRVGLSYQSPIWYNLTERFVITDPDSVYDNTPYPWVDGQLDVIVSNSNNGYFNETIPNFFDYELKTPGKTTASLAYVFGKSGLISFDYTYQDFSNIQISPSSYFIDENNYLSQNLSKTSSFKIGTEWNIKKISIRGGYHYTESPYKFASTSNDIMGYSAGLGLKLSNHMKLDFSFDKSTYVDQYKIIDIDVVTPAKLNIETSHFTSTLVYNF